MSNANNEVNIDVAAPMSAASTEAEQRNYLRHRLNCIEDEKEETLRRTYGLKDQDPPKTPQEVVDRIKTGMFVFHTPGKEADKLYWQWSNPLRDIRWRDPNQKEDPNGFVVAQEVLGAQRILLQDTIAIKTPLEALTELQTWEAQT